VTCCKILTLKFLTEIDEEFLTNCNDLARHLFDELVVKEFNGVQVKGKDMINLAMLYSEKFKGQKLDTSVLYEVSKVNKVCICYCSERNSLKQCQNYKFASIFCYVICFRLK